MLRALVVVSLGWVCLGCSSPDPEPPVGGPSSIAHERARAADDPTHRPRWDGASVRLAGAEIADGVARVGGLALALASIGRTEAVACDEGATTVVGPEVRIARAAGITEWWRSLDRGLEHGVTVKERPEGEGALRLTVALGPGVRARDAGDGTLALVGPEGTLATYGQLFVLDADGRTVPSRLAAAGPVAHIEVDDRDARYPIVVDPLLITSIGSATVDFFSTYYDVSVSDSGERVIGGSSSVLHGSGTSWTIEPSFDPLGSTIGILAADGDFAVDSAGMTWAFDGTRWTSRVLPTPPSGCNVLAVSRDENVIALGCPDVHTWVARVHLSSTVTSSSYRSIALTSNGDRMVTGASVYTRSATGWMLEHTFPDPSGAVGFGRDCDISGDGSRVVIGARRTSDPATRPAYVFVRTGTTWALEDGLASPATASSVDGSVAIDEEGSAVLVGLTRTDGTLVRQRAQYYLRTGTTWTRTELPDPPGAGTPLGVHVALSSSGTTGALTVSNNTVTVFRFSGAGPAGAACTAADQCRGGICVDGVCCSSACAGGTGDCQACSIAAGGTDDGTCTALSAAAAPTVTCRASAGACDVAETCSDASTTCPPDAVLPGDTICRAAAPGGCDVAERCDGRATVCAPDGFAAPGTTCGGGADGPCGLGGTCNASGTCMQGYRPAGTVCQPSAGDCDLDDVCNGSSAECLPRFQPASFVCRAQNGLCDVAEACTGFTTDCPSDGFRPAGTVCNTAMDGVCDTPDECTGASGECLARFLVGTTCRASAGTCDAAETCLGDAADCPEDQLAPSGTVCRASGGACDPSESCDGATAACPADESECVDAPRDGGAGDDVGTPPAPVAGCACRAGGPAGPPLMVLVALAGVLAARRRR